MRRFRARGGCSPQSASALAASLSFYFCADPVDTTFLEIRGDQAEKPFGIFYQNLSSAISGIARRDDFINSILGFKKTDMVLGNETQVDHDYYLVTLLRDPRKLNSLAQPVNMRLYRLNLHNARNCWLSTMLQSCNHAFAIQAQNDCSITPICSFTAIVPLPPMNQMLSQALLNEVMAHYEKYVEYGSQQEETQQVARHGFFARLFHSIVARLRAKRTDAKPRKPSSKSVRVRFDDLPSKMRIVYPAGKRVSG